MKIFTLKAKFKFLPLCFIHLQHEVESNPCGTNSIALAVQYSGRCPVLGSWMAVTKAVLTWLKRKISFLCFSQK